MVSLPFKPGMRVIELGGGANPMIRPNVDIRGGPSVDLVADFNRKLPLASGSVDGILCKFALEHISWKKVRQFISETYRALAPGGIAVFITANLLEQARKVVEAGDKGELNDDLVCMIFGGQSVEGEDDWFGTWAAEAHHCGFSPDFAIKLFKAAGYFEVKVYPLPGCNTDMVIEAYKSKAEVRFGLG